MKKKKILYIHHGKGIGGAPLSLLYLIQALDKDQYEPVVLFLNDSDAFTLFKKHNIPVVGPVNRYDFPHTRIWWLRWYHGLFFLKVLRDFFSTRYYLAHEWINLINPDIIHLNTSSLIAWGIVAHKKNIPVVWHIRELLATGHLGIRKRLITHLIRKHSSAIIPICKHDSKPWEWDTKTTVVYNAAHTTIFDHTTSTESFIKQYNLDTTAPKLLFLGGLSREKGTELLLTVFEKLRAKVPHVQLVLAGYFQLPMKKKSFSPHYHFTQTVKKLYSRNADAIRLIGPIDHVNQALAASDVLVFPATVGHFARPVIEAGFMKKPVVASSCPPLDELVVHNTTGFLVDPYAIDKWVNYLSLLLTNKKLQQTMGEAGYRFCLENFSIEEQIKKIENIYERVSERLP